MQNAITVQLQCNIVQKEVHLSSSFSLILIELHVYVNLLDKMIESSDSIIQRP